jgi:hypothetical protein
VTDEVYFAFSVCVIALLQGYLCLHRRVWFLKVLIDVVVVTVWTTYRLCVDSNDVPLDIRTHRTGLSRREVV